MSQQHSLTERVDKLYEFERAPVTEDRLQSGKHFAALFGGEHVAGTEFVIGGAFISFGASAADVLIGLLIGNALAVLSWTLICAPIAVKTRLTLYWYLRRIAGPGLTSLYNVLNALMFCILSGTMITVSASAVRIPFGIPAQTKWYPEDARFVFVVLVVGTVVVGVAILGFRRLVQFSVVCVPWLFVMFFAGAVAALPLLAQQTSTGALSGMADLWRIANEMVYIHNPESGLGMWHIVAFAWICNIAFHVGLSDMAVLRYAPRASYGLFSAFGMYLGHYLAWVCAGVMGATTALILKKGITELDAGQVAYQTLGVSGILAVIIAGWATSNPTLYRAGLALQTVTPAWPRWLVTLLAGVGTTIVACFPFVFSRLLDFVALYGILLSPVGAIVFVEHWLFPILGWRRYWFNATGKWISWPALAAWFICVGIAIGLWWTETLHIFFIAIPLWFVAAALYVVLAGCFGARSSKAAVKESESSLTPAPVVGPVPHLPRPLWLRLVGALALLTLMVALALPVWVILGGNALYDSRLESYFDWLGVMSVVHLIAVATWVVAGDRQRTAKE